MPCAVLCYSVKRKKNVSGGKHLHQHRGRREVIVRKPCRCGNIPVTAIPPPVPLNRIANGTCGPWIEFATSVRMLWGSPYVYIYNIYIILWIILLYMYIVYMLYVGHVEWIVSCVGRPLITKMSDKGPKDYCYQKFCVFWFVYWYSICHTDATTATIRHSYRGTSDNLHVQSELKHITW